MNQQSTRLIPGAYSPAFSRYPMHKLRTLPQIMALPVTLIGASIPWLRLAIRGHVEFCAGECNPRDWFDYAGSIGSLLAVGIPTAVLCWLALRAFRRGERSWKAVLAWLFILTCTVASEVRLVQLEDAYFAQF
ncbi:hypothetical protein L7Q78_10930 [Achromobacter xylosoxidans]|nr:hypothetical protein [Achromobacter xylosoxidans]